MCWLLRCTGTAVRMNTALSSKPAWVLQDGEEVIATPGDIVFKPRGHWHTFWNAGDGQLRILEVIAPGGLEEAFRPAGGRRLRPSDAACPGRRVRR